MTQEKHFKVKCKHCGEFFPARARNVKYGCPNPRCSELEEFEFKLRERRYQANHRRREKMANMRKGGDFDA